jgi:hypothetical protein
MLMMLSCSGTLTLFNPSNTTYVKHFMIVIVMHLEDGDCNNSTIL